MSGIRVAVKLHFMFPVKRQRVANPILSLIFLLSLCARALAGSLTFEPRYGLVAPEVTLPESSQQWLKKHRTLRVGVWQNALPPYSVSFEKNVYEGLSADYLAIVAKALKLPVKMKQYPSRLALAEALRKGEVDLIPYYTLAADRGD